MINWIKRISIFIRKNKTRIKHVGIGRVIYDTASWLFDNPFYIGVIAWKGPLVGGAILTFLSFILCFITLIVYERMKVEWTGVDVIDDLREKGIEYANKIHNRGKHESFRQLSTRIVFFIPAKLFVFAMWLMKSFGDIAAFFVLSIFQDPFYTTAYLRHGRFDGLKTKDYSVFFASVLVSNGYWILRNWGLIAIFLLIWRATIHFFVH